ncbi:unnamed protein product [Closterium sp. Yama58-4]|nr:unnamed protein product [Closterium sp. Yama58-4]
MVASDLSASPAQPAQSHIPVTVASVTSGAASIDEQYLESQARRWLSQTLSRTLPVDKPLSDLLGDGEILLELACLVQQLLAPDVPPSASVPLTPAAAADAADGAAEGGGGGVSAGGDSSSSANRGCSSEESGDVAGGSGFKRAYWHACTNVERFLKVCRRVGLRDVSLFTSPDLVDGRDVRRVCLCLRTLSKRLVGIRDFDGIMEEERRSMAGAIPAGLPSLRDWRGERADAWHESHEQRHVYHRHRQHSSECNRVHDAPHEQQHLYNRHSQHRDQHHRVSALESRQDSHRLSEYHRGLEQKQKQSGERHLGASAAAAVPAAAGAAGAWAAVSAAPVDVSPRFLPPDPTSLTPVLPDHLSSPRRVASPLSRTHSNASSTSTALHSTHSLSRHSHTRGSHRSHSHALGLVGEGEGEQRRRGVWDLVAAAGAVALVGGAMVMANRTNRRTREERRRRALEYERPSFTDHIAQRPHLGMGFGGVFELNFGDTPVAAAHIHAAADDEGEGQEGSEGGRERGREGGRERGAAQVVGEDERTGLGRREARPPWFMSLGSQRNSTSTGEARNTTSTTGSSSNASGSSSGGWRRGPEPLPRWQQAELVLRQQREMVIRRLHGERRSMAEIWWVQMGANGCWRVYC